jgi:hypothetical protein
MAFVMKDRVRVKTATTGTGAIALGAAVQDSARGYYRAFAVAGVADGDTVPYMVEDGADWETGIGTYAVSGAVLTRTTVINNSAGTTSPISLSGSAEVAIVVTEQVMNLLLRSDLSIQALGGGFTGTAIDDGTKGGGTYTPSPAGGNFRKITSAGGAFTFAAPSATGCYNIEVDITIGAAAGAITFTGFVSGYPKGDDLTLTSGHKFKLHISKTDAGVTAVVEALQ